MAGDLAIHVDTKSLEQYPRGTVVGKIWFQAGSVAFPEENWNDFVVTVLTWWSDALCTLMSSPNTDAEFLFEDGPFEFHARSHQDRVYLAAVDRTHGEDASAFAEVDIAVLRREILHAAGLVLEAAKAKNWTSQDIDELHRATEALSRTSIPGGSSGDGGNNPRFREHL
jgi:hypothetical protein